MFENTIFRFLEIYILRILALCIPFVLSSCFGRKLAARRREYRKDENGTEILFEIEAEQPFGSPKRAYVSEKHPNGEPHFKIGFSHGFKRRSFSLLARQWVKTSIWFFQKERGRVYLRHTARLGISLREKLSQW